MCLAAAAHSKPVAATGKTDGHAGKKPKKLNGNKKK